MKYQMIDRCRDAYPVTLMCQNLKVSSSGYYDWKRREPSARAVTNERLLKKITELHQDSDSVKGAPRIWEDLLYAGEACSKNRVARLMSKHGLYGIPQKRKWRRKVTGTQPAGVQNLLERNFQAEKPNQKWVTDITYIKTGEGYLYLCVVLDLFTGMVVGWSMSHKQDREMVIQAVLMALWQRSDKTQEVILHSDRGCQFTSHDYQQFLKGHNLVYSMSRVGSCADNAACEGFFGLLKRERVERRKYLSRQEARSDVFDYIERFHNPRKRRRMEQPKIQKSLLTKLSVETG